MILLPYVVHAAEQVAVDRDGSVFRIHIETPVVADVQTAWEVLTDYDHLAEFVPGMRESRAIRVPGQPLRLEQKGEMRVLFFTTAIHVTFEIEETPRERIAFKTVAGNMKQMHGMWRIVPMESGVNLVYEAELEPDFWVSLLISKAFVQNNALLQFQGVVAEMLKRRAAVSDKHDSK